MERPGLDIVVKTQFKTLPLFRIFLESLNFHFSGDWDLYVIVDADCLAEFATWDLGPRARLIYADDLLKGAAHYNGYLAQQYFKLRAYDFCERENILILDDDFVFLRETSPEHFFVDGKPIWCLQDWGAAGAAARWRLHAETFLGAPLPYCFMSSNPTMFLRSVLKDLADHHSLMRIFEFDEFSEFTAYGAFAWHRHRDAYHWLKNYWGPEALFVAVNQVPPTYLYLDPSVSFESFQHYSYVAFWSHWKSCESKMREFFTASMVKTSAEHGA